MRWIALLPLLLVGPPRVGAEPLPVCGACRVDADELRRGYEPKVWQKMAGGEVVTSKKDFEDENGSPKSRVEASAIMAFDPTQVWTVLTDFEARPRYISTAKEVRVVKSEGNRVWLAEHLKVLFVDIRFQAVNTLDAEHGVLSWELDKSVPHDIENTTGTWAIHPIAARQTLVKYGASVESGRPVPALIEDFLAARSLPGLLGGLRDELRRRFP